MKLRKGLETDLQIVLDRISASRRILSPTSMSSQDFGFERDKWADVIESMIEADEVSPHAKREIIDKSCRLHQNLARKQFLADFQRLLQEYLSSTEKKYLVVYPIMGPIEAMPKLLRMNGCHINFSPAKTTRPYKSIVAARAYQTETDEQLKPFHDDLRKCNLVACSILARSTFDAVHYSERALRLSLGLGSLATSYGNNSYSLIGRDGPICRLLVGPHITVHNPDGKLATDESLRWFVDWMVGAPSPWLSQESAVVAQKNVLQFIKQIRLRRGVWKKFLEDRMIEYHESFSEPSFSNSFLKAWRLFEMLTGVTRGESEKGVKRAQSLFGDSDNVRIFGQHLRFRRNQMVHSTPVLGMERHRTCLQLKSLIEPLLLQFFYNRESFSKPADFWAVLDNMALDAHEVERRKSLLEFSIDRSERLKRPKLKK